MKKQSMAIAVCLIAAAYGGAAVGGDKGGNPNDIQKLLSEGSTNLNLDDVDKINDYSERLQKLDAIEGYLKSIEQKQQDRARLKNGDTYFGEGAPGPAGAPGAPSGVSLPSSGFAVDHLDGSEGVYTAVLIDSTGRRMSVSRGTSLGGDIKVQSITFKDGVIVVDGQGREKPLPFAAQKQDNPAGLQRQGGGY